MKTTYIIALIIVSMMMSSCKKETKISDKNHMAVDFVILGTAKNGDGKKLGLHIPSLGLDNRLTSEIKNGKFSFKGTVQQQERAELAFDNELETFDGSYALYDIFLNNDTLNIEVTVDESNGNLYFSEMSFNDNGVNSYYYETIEDYWKSFGNLIYNRNDSIQMDSLKTYVFPEIRTNVLKVNKELYNAENYTIIGLHNIKLMLKEGTIFDLKDMGVEDKRAITDFFNNVDDSNRNAPDYRVVNSYVKRINDVNFGKGFMDFALPDISNTERRLSKIISKNEFTVLDFWWSGCAPCRKFNQESKEHYKELKENGIEIVSINVDDGMKKWQTASKKDSIEWINLYAGAYSKIEADYNVVAFPTTIIVDKNKNIVDFEFKKATELLKLKENK